MGCFGMNDLQGKRLLVLGGTRISCEIIEKAQELGIIVAVTDYNTIEDSPGKQLADEAYSVSATDVNDVVSLIKNKNIDGVIVGFNDMLLPYYADICQKANLPCYGTKEQFKIFTNKDLYKNLCRKYGVPTVEEYSVSLNSFDEDVKKIKFPVLVKPADNSGARGIFICKDKEELYTCYNKCFNYTKTGKILIEQYLTGNEVTVFFVFQDGNFYLTGIGNRHVKLSKAGVIPLPVGYTFPASVTDTYIDNILPKVKIMLKDLGIMNGMMFMQCKVEDGIVVAYDIGFRLTASLEYRIFDECCGYNPLEMMIRFALTGKMAKYDLKDKIISDLGAYAYNVSFLAEPGVIKNIQGVKSVSSMEGVAGAVIAHFPGEEITESMEGLLSQISVRVVGKAKNEIDLWNKINYIQNKITIISEKGNNLVFRRIEKEDFKGLLKKV